jgi:hypothetical protein
MKGDLWLTDARFSNDADELRHGSDIVREVVEEQAHMGATPLIQELARRVAAEFMPGRTAFMPPDPVYVCCFCEKQDLLSQWRGYGSSGGGFAIEIDPAAFSYLAGADCPIGVMRFWKVFYTDVEKRKRARDVITFWAAQPDSPEHRALAAAATLQFFIPTFKHESFLEEAEWRLIFTPGPTCHVPPKFRTARGLLVPYFELRELVKTFANPERLAIKKVCVGPGAYKEVNGVSAKLLLDSYGFQGAEVILSDVPYRG